MNDIAKAFAAIAIARATNAGLVLAHAALYDAADALSRDIRDAGIDELVRTYADAGSTGPVLLGCDPRSGLLADAFDYICIVRGLPNRAQVC